jgi:hypoxia up-regulated 1
MQMNLLSLVRRLPAVVQILNLPLGAAFHGAGLSRQFKTKEIKVVDIGIHDIQARYFATSTINSDEPRTITSLIFPAGSKTGTQKILTFKRKEDFSLWLDYKNDPAPYVPSNNQ